MCARPLRQAHAVAAAAWNSAGADQQRLEEREEDDRHNDESDDAERSHGHVAFLAVDLVVVHGAIPMQVGVQLHRPARVREGEAGSLADP